MAIKQTAQLEQALQQAFDRHASDLFLIPGEPVSFRVRGHVERAEGDPLTAEQVRAIAAAAIGEEELERIQRQTGGVRTSCGLPGVIDGQMTVASSLGQYSIVVRVLPRAVLDAKAIGLPEAMLEAAGASHGLIVVAGPTGSGKSTSALSLLDHINATRPVHIWTLEDPVCARLTPKQALVQHHEVGTDVPDTLTGLRCAMRQDIDVLFLGELKSQSEVEAAVTVADTGHLVIVVAHGTSPEDLVERFIDIHPSETRERFCKRFAAVLRAVSVQCLLPKAAGKGRVAAYGVLVPDEETRAGIIEGRDIRKRTTPLPRGSQRLSDDIERLRDEGVVAAEAAQNALAALEGS